jgi:hypothetical protein
LTLYELTEQYRELSDMLDDGEIDDQVFNDTLEAMDWKSNFEDKADACQKIILDLLGNAAKMKTEKERLAARQAAFEKNAERLKQALFAAMKKCNRSKFQTVFATYTI